MIRAVADELIEDGSERATEAPPIDLDALFRAEGDGVYRTLYAFTGGRADVAEEATAEAFARAVASRDALRDPLGWIYRVAFRVAIDELRRDRRRGPWSMRRSSRRSSQASSVRSANCLRTSVRRSSCAT
jgi:DNA-directed RNA polymerase specialized sigma24 family protein